VKWITAIPRKEVIRCRFLLPSRAVEELVLYYRMLHKTIKEKEKNRMRSLKMLCWGITVLCFMAVVSGAMATDPHEFTNMVCEKTRYSTGPGVRPPICAPGKEIVIKTGTIVATGNEVQDKEGLLCYPPCPSGFKGVGPVCWKQCPSGYHDDGAVCRKDAHIFGKDSYERGVGIVKKDAQHTSYEVGLWYVPCKKDYSGAATRCYQQCPSGYRDDGATCRRDVHILGKQTVTRGVGTLPTICPFDYYKNSFGSCYRNCKPGYKASEEVGIGKCTKSCSSTTVADGGKWGKWPASVDCGNGYCGHSQETCERFKQRISSTCTRATVGVGNLTTDQHVNRECVYGYVNECK
jgi:hypothetical protein